MRFEISEQDLAAAKKLLSRLVTKPCSEEDIDDRRLSEIAGAIYNSRRERRHFFAETLFADPAWDMLLTLYCAESAGEPLSVSSACVSADVPQTTALRWLNALVAMGLLQRCAHPTDGRSQLVKLAPDTRSKMDQYIRRIAARQLQLLGNH